MELKTEHAITTWLRSSHPLWLTIYASVASFSLYTCVYAFRKTFAVATFDGISYGAISYKGWLVIAQVMGYALSKFIGIKIIAELKAKSRASGIVLLVTIAGLAWLGFGLTPAPYNIVFLFMNGLPLGMIWGMVFGYLEGRRMTEVLGAALSVSFIFSSGLCRSAGAHIIQAWHVSETWMPFTAALIFAAPLLIFLWLLDKLPPPSPLDEALRTKRAPMDKKERKAFLKTFLPGIVLFVVCYMLLTIFRDFRDNYSAEVWSSLGYKTSSGIYTTTEIPISFAVLLIMGSLMLIKNNQRALLINHIIIGIGMLLIGVSTWLFQSDLVSPTAWFVLIGLGLYMGYVPFNSIFFDRMLAAFHYTGTVGFIMYVSDSFGYLGSVSIIIFKEIGYSDVSWLHVFIKAGYGISVVGTLLIIGSMIYFQLKHARWRRSNQELSDSVANEGVQTVEAMTA